MNRLAYFIIATASVFAGCGNNTNRQTAGETENDSTAIQEIKTINTDGTEVSWIRDNAEERLMPRSLFADAPDSIFSKLKLADGIPSSMSAFLVRKEGISILFDTGLGGDNSRLIPNLKSLGTEAADIRYLYLTHFHGDHIGGMMKGDSIVFPNAEIYASKAEYEAWMNMPATQNAQVVKTMNAYKRHLHLFEFGDTLPGDVIAINAIGHTPGHTAYQTGKLIIVGDLMHGTALQYAHPEYCADYDMDKEKSIETRKNILKYANDNGLTMAGMHFPDPGFINPETGRQ